VSVVFAFAFLALLVVVVAGGSKPTVTWGTNPSSMLGLPYSRQRYIPALRSGSGRHATQDGTIAGRRRYNFSERSNAVDRSRRQSVFLRGGMV
jgi:hypothetical protein